MKHDSQFVNGGGWVVREVTGRPKLRRFGFLSLAWFPVAFVAVIPLLNNTTGFSWVDWTYAMVVVPEPVFLTLAAICWFTETPRKYTEQVPNADHDPYGLY
jgi:hypothetical protein